MVHEKNWSSIVVTGGKLPCGVWVLGPDYLGRMVGVHLKHVMWPILDWLYFIHRFRRFVLHRILYQSNAVANFCVSTAEKCSYGRMLKLSVFFPKARVTQFLGWVGTSCSGFDLLSLVWICLTWSIQSLVMNLPPATETFLGIGWWTQLVVATWLLPRDELISFEPSLLRCCDSRKTRRKGRWLVFSPSADGCNCLNCVLQCLYPDWLPALSYLDHRMRWLYLILCLITCTWES